MKKVFFALSAIVALAFYVTPAAAQAQSFTINDKIQVSSSVYNQCTEEFIAYDGTFHNMVHSTYNAKQGTYKINTTLNTQGIKGVGETTGNGYQLNQTVHQSVIENIDACTAKVTVIVNGNWTTAGSDNNFYYKERITYTYNYCTFELIDVKREVFESGCR